MKNKFEWEPAFFSSNPRKENCLFSATLIARLLPNLVALKGVTSLLNILFLIVSAFVCLFLAEVLC